MCAALASAMIVFKAIVAHGRVAIVAVTTRRDVIAETAEYGELFIGRWHANRKTAIQVPQDFRLHPGGLLRAWIVPFQ